jgi:hypothetical protein
MRGFSEPSVIDITLTQDVEGNIRRQFCLPPEGRSPLEIVRNYQQAMEAAGGRIICTSRDPGSLKIEDKRFLDYLADSLALHGRVAIYDIMS